MSTKNMESPARNEKEIEVIRQFRKNVSDVLKADDTDHFLYRWLTYADFDLIESEKTLRTCVLCRTCQQIDEITKTFIVPDVWKKYGFSDLIGFSKEGLPVRYMPVGRADYDGLMKTISTVTLDRLCAYLISSDMEILRERDRKKGIVRDEGQIIIFDLEGFSIQKFAHKHVLECLIDLMKMYQDYYTAGVIKLILIINAPFYYPLVVNLFRPILRSTMLEKLRIYSKATTTEMLLKIIDEEELPAFLGGKKVDCNGDPKCSGFIGAGGTIPESYYYHNNPHEPLSGPDMMEVSIKPRYHHDFVVSVPEPQSIVRIKFQSNSSIGLSVYYKTNLIKKDFDDCDNDDDCEEVCCSPYSRIQSHLVPEDMEIFCQHSGTYIFRLDNSFCWTQTKHIFFQSEILPKDKSELL